MSERTLVLIKPDAVTRGLVGRIIDRFEQRGLTLVGAKLLVVHGELADEHYAEHREKPFFGELVGVHHLVADAGARSRGRLRDPGRARRRWGRRTRSSAAPGTIRGDFALAMPNNLVHGSDSPESAAREIGLWFSDDELV